MKMMIREDGGGKKRSRLAITVGDGKLKKAGTNTRKRIGMRMRSTDSPGINTFVEDKLEIVNLEEIEGMGKSSSDPANEGAFLAPTKRVLELILDTLQRRDAYELFAQPVDPTEVEDYSEIIKHPMDFGTMRAKLHEDMYQFLHQFEHDVFLIYWNAMHFNTSTSIYFKQARALKELAKKVFQTLKTDPEKFELEFATTKRRYARKFCNDDKDKDSNLGSRSKHRRDNKRTKDKGTYLANLVARDNKRTKDKSTMIYVGCAPLMQVSQQKHGYTESLMAFVNDLGATANRVALRMMKALQDSNLTDVAFISCKKKSRDDGKRTEDARIVNKQIVLAVPAASQARGHNCPNHTQINMPFTVKGRHFYQKTNDSSTCSPCILVDIVEKNKEDENESSKEAWKIG